jgi:hypothetical protein
MHHGLAFIQLAKARHCDHMRALEEATRQGRHIRRERPRAASRFRRHHVRAGSRVEEVAA